MKTVLSLKEKLQKLIEKFSAVSKNSSNAPESIIPYSDNNSFSVMDSLAQLTTDKTLKLEKDICIALAFGENKQLLVASNGEEVSEKAQDRIKKWHAYFKDRKNIDRQNEITELLADKLKLSLEYLIEEMNRESRARIDIIQGLDKAKEKLEKIVEGFSKPPGENKWKEHPYLSLGEFQGIIDKANKSLSFFTYPRPEAFYLKNIWNIVNNAELGSNVEIESQIKRIADSNLDFVTIKHFENDDAKKINSISEKTEKAIHEIGILETEISSLVLVKKKEKEDEKLGDNIKQIEEKIVEYRKKVIEWKDVITDFFFEDTGVEITHKEFDEIFENQGWKISIEKIFKDLVTGKRDYKKIHAEMKLLWIIGCSGITDRIGISKFCCAPCYLTLDLLSLSKKVAGCQGRTVDQFWKVPEIPGLTEKLALRFITVGNEKLQGKFEELLKSINLNKEKRSFINYAIRTLNKDLSVTNSEFKINTYSEKNTAFKKVLTRLDEKIETKMIVDRGRKIDKQLIIQIDNENVVKKVAENFLDNEKSKKRDAKIVVIDKEKSTYTFNDKDKVELNPGENISLTIVTHENIFERGNIKDIVESIKTSVGDYYNLKSDTEIFVSLVSCNRPEKGTKDIAKSRADYRAEYLMDVLSKKSTTRNELNIQAVIARDGYIRVGRKINEFNELKVRTQYSNKKGKKGYEWFFRSPEEGLEDNKVIYYRKKDGSRRWDTVPAKERVELESDSQDFFEWSGVLSRTESFTNTVTYLRKDHQLSENFEIKIESLKIDENGERTVKFVDTATKQDGPEIKLKENEFHELEEFKEYFHERLAETKEVDTPHGLTAAFAVLAIFDFLERDKFQRGGIASVKEWLNYTQILLDGTHDVYKFADIVNTARKGLNSGLFGTEFAGRISKFSGYGGTALNAVFVGLDFAELLNADTNFEKEIAEIHLFADSSGLALGITGMIAGGTAGAFLGIVGIPVAGVTFGVVALLSLYAEDREKAFRVAEYFLECENDYSLMENNLLEFSEYTLVSLGYSGLSIENGKINSVKSRYNNAVITKIDFTNEGEIKVTRDSEYIYKNLGQDAWNRDKVIGYHQMTGSDGKKETALNFRELLNLSETVSIKPKHSNLEIILPSIPKSYISYSYDTVPSIMNYFPHVSKEQDFRNSIKNEDRLSTVLKMEQTGKFFFRYECTAFLWITNSWAIRDDLRFDYQDTNVEILLDKESAAFVAPQLDPKIKNNLSYNFKNGRGNYMLMLSKDSADCKIENSAVDSTWNINAENLVFDIGRENNDQVEIIFKNENAESKKVNITRVFFAKPYPKLVVKSKEFEQKIDLTDSVVLETTTFNETGIRSKEEIDKILLQEVSHKGYIEIDNHHINENQDIKAWYDNEKKRYFYLLLDDQDKKDYNVYQNITVDKETKKKSYEPYNEYNLLGAIEESFYYFLPEKKVVFYQESFDSKAKKIATGIKRAFFNNRQVFASIEEEEVLIILEKEQKKLWRINEQKKFSSVEEIVKTCQKNQWEVAKIVPFFSGEVAIYKWYIPELKAIITLQEEKAGEFQFSTWKKLADEKIIYFFHNVQEKKVYFKEQVMLETNISNLSRIDIPETVIGLSTETSSVVAVSENGCYFRIHENGNYTLEAINDKWFSGKEGKSIEQVIRNLDKNYHAEEVLTLIGKVFIAHYNFEKNIVISAPQDKVLVGYDQERGRVYSYNQITKEISYNYTEEDNAKNCFVQKEDNFHVLEWKNYQWETIVGLPIFTEKVHLGTDKNLSIIDTKGRIFSASENVLTGNWELTLIALDNRWVRDKVQDNKDRTELCKVLTEVTHSPVYSSKKIIAFDHYLNKNKWWYDSSTNDLIELVNSDQNRQIQYLVSDLSNKKTYFSEVGCLEIQEGTESKKVIEKLQPTNFTELRFFDKEIAVRTVAKEGIEVKIPLFEGFSSVLVSASTGQKNYIIEEQTLIHYQAIVLDFIADDGIANNIKIYLPHSAFKLSWEGSNYILNYQENVMLITGYGKDVNLFFKEDEGFKKVTLSQNSLDSKTANIDGEVTMQIVEMPLYSYLDDF